MSYDARKECPAVKKATAAYIASLLDDILVPMRMAARGKGYAITVHGSLSRDIDLVAIPWSEDASPVEELLDALAGSVAGTLGRAGILSGPDNKFRLVEKPHGRVAVTMYIVGIVSEIDLSIMPRIVKEKP